MLGKFHLRHPLSPVLLGFLLSLPLILPYFHPGYFPTHDGEWAVVRLGDMYRELRDVQFPARFSGNLNFGYGYPLFEFAYPLPYYLGFLFHIFHISFVNCIKILFALSVPLSFFTMYFFSSRLWQSRLAGIVSGAVYIYYPYRLVDLYVRGSIGESLCFILFPLILFFMLRVYQKHNTGDTVWAGISIAALITTHNIMTVEFMIIVGIFCLVAIIQEKKNFKQLGINFGIAIFLGLGLSCFFWLPALTEVKLIALSLIPIADRSLYFVQPLQLLLPSWGYGTMNFSYQLGISHILALLLIVCSLFIPAKKPTGTFTQKIIWYFLGLMVVYLFLLFPPSLFLWKILPFFKEINYPWTLLAPIGFLIAVLVGSLLRQKTFRFISIALVGFAILYGLQYAHPQAYVNRGDNYYLTNDATTTSSDEYMPVWVKQKPLERVGEKFTVIKGNAIVKNQHGSSKQFSADITSQTKSLIQINMIYYPGWHMTLDGQNVIPDYQNIKGLMQLTVPAGSHQLQGKFSETTLRLFADCVSLLSICVILLLCFPFVRRRMYVAK